MTIWRLKLTKQFFYETEYYDGGMEDDACTQSSKDDDG